MRRASERIRPRGSRFARSATFALVTVSQIVARLPLRADRTLRPRLPPRLRLVRRASDSVVYLAPRPSVIPDSRLSVVCYGAPNCPWLLHGQLSAEEVKRRLSSVAETLSRFGQASPEPTLDVTVMLSGSGAAAHVPTAVASSGPPAASTRRTPNGALRPKRSDNWTQTLGPLQMAAVRQWKRSGVMARGAGLPAALKRR